MKRMGVTLSMLVLAGSLAGSAIAAEDGFLLKERASNSSNYCHMKFPAIKEGTLAGKHPQLKDASSGDIIDFYGLCDESPTGQHQLQAQRAYEERTGPLTGEE